MLQMLDLHQQHLELLVALALPAEADQAQLAAAANASLSAKPEGSAITTAQPGESRTHAAWMLPNDRLAAVSWRESGYLLDRGKRRLF